MWDYLQLILLIAKVLTDLLYYFLKEWRRKMNGKPFGLSSLSATPVSSKSETPPIEVEDPLLTVTTEKKKK